PDLDITDVSLLGLQKQNRLYSACECFLEGDASVSFKDRIARPILPLQAECSSKSDVAVEEPWIFVGDFAVRAAACVSRGGEKNVPQPFIFSFRVAPPQDKAVKCVVAAIKSEYFCSSFARCCQK